MLKFKTEWLDAPGVKDPVLASTWARFEIDVDGSGPRLHAPPSSVINFKANSVQRGVDGTVFPLAEWIVENWWFVLHEAARVPQFMGGRILSKQGPSFHSWTQRHCLLAAQEGGALPDFSIYRDGEQIVMKWVPDPESGLGNRRVRFFDDGELRVAPDQAEMLLHSFIETVLSRIVSRHDDAAERLRKEWKAVCKSRSDEPELCGWAASMGIDPYGEDELTDDLVNLFETRIRPLSPKLRSDFLETTNNTSLSGDLVWLESSLTEVNCNETPFSRQRSGSAHQYGYALARDFRKQFGVSTTSPIENLPKLLHDKCGWPGINTPVKVVEGTKNVVALVANDRDGNPVLVGPLVGRQANRFRQARSIFFFPFDEFKTAPRLVTNAYTWEQRASRAFAAELLAPSEALRNEVSGKVSIDEMRLLSRKFHVRPELIEHQLLNHQIGFSEAA